MKASCGEVHIVPRPITRPVNSRSRNWRFRNGWSSRYHGGSSDQQRSHFAIGWWPGWVIGQLDAHGECLGSAAPQGAGSQSRVLEPGPGQRQVRAAKSRRLVHHRQCYAGLGSLDRLRFRLRRLEISRSVVHGGQLGVFDRHATGCRLGIRSFLRRKSIERVFPQRARCEAQPRESRDRRTDSIGALIFQERFRQIQPQPRLRLAVIPETETHPTRVRFCLADGNSRNEWFF